MFLGVAGLAAGGTYAGVSSYKSGNRGWDLVGDIALGALSLGIAGFAIGAWLGAGAGALLAGNLFAQASSVFAGATYAWEMLLAGGMIPTLYMLGSNLYNSFHYTTHVFWSGGNVAASKALELANSIGGTTLNMTKLGQYLNSIDASHQLWEIASKNFANQVHQNGIVRAIFYYPLMKNNAIWFIEQKILLEKSVKIIVEIIIGGN